MLAVDDPLTGFLNRRSLAEEGAAMVVRAERRHKAMALLMLDLDHFKTVNDMHGHAVGDALLRAVAERDRAPPCPTWRWRRGSAATNSPARLLFDPEQPRQRRARRRAAGRRG